MRDPEEKPRQFAVRKKRDEYDEPAVRRRKLREEDEEPRRRRAFSEEDEEGDGKARPGFLSRRATLREREEAEDEEEKQSRTRFRRSRREEEDVEDDEEEEGEDEGRKAPKVVRIFAWIALLVILFALGYLGANYFFGLADRRGARVGDVYGSSSEVPKTQSPDAAAPAAAGTAAYDVYVPDGGKLTKRTIDIQKGLVEDDITKVASVFVDSLKETNALAGDASVLNVFRNGDCLYLDMSGAFQTSLKKLGADPGKLVVTGLVKTMKENFDPITRIKFYVDGKESVMKTPVDLTVPCEAN